VSVPTFSRKSLRQNLGLNHLHDTYVGTTTATGPAIVDQFTADTSLTNQSLFERAWLKHNSMELRVASFNIGSGAHVTGMVLGTLVLSGAEYERHDLLRPSEKDRAIDDAVKRLRIRQEVGLPSVDGGILYDIDTAASPASIVSPEDVLDAYYYANPTNSLDRDRRAFAQWAVVQTGSGMELRAEPKLSGSYQIVLDALITLTLGSADTATINIPDERLVLFGAEAQCWHLLAKTAPGTVRASYAQSRDEAARAYSDLAAKFKRPVARSLQFEQPVTDGLPRAGFFI
jgi:hypothetical protein